MKNKKNIIALLIFFIGLAFIVLIVNFFTTHNYDINECLEKFKEQDISKEDRERLCQCIIEEKDDYTLKAGAEEYCINIFSPMPSQQE